MRNLPSVRSVAYYLTIIVLFAIAVLAGALALDQNGSPSARTGGAILTFFTMFLAVIQTQPILHDMLHRSKALSDAQYKNVFEELRVSAEDITAKRYASAI